MATTIKQPAELAGGGAQQEKRTGLLGKQAEVSDKLKESRIAQNAAGQDVLQYSPYEKWVARLMLIYLLGTFLFGFWAMADAFHGGATILSWFRPAASPQGTGTTVSSASPTCTPSMGIAVAATSNTPGPTSPSPCGASIPGNGTPVASTEPASTRKSTATIPGTEAADTFVLLATSAGWLGATIAAMRSLCDHYAAPVENASSLFRQEAQRFHTQWSIRWVAGPLMGASLTLIVFALVQSGVLPFAIGQYSAQDLSQDLSVKNEFAAIGFGGLIGLAAKDVIERLIQIVKSALSVEEPTAKALQVSPSDASVQFGGTPVRFAVDPEIPVTWTVEPANVANVGCFANGVFRPLDKAPEDLPQSYAVVVTATSKTDASQSASAILTLEKPAEG